MDKKTKPVLDILPQAIASTDADLYCRYANRAYAELLGRTPESMIGVHSRELWGGKSFAEMEPHLKRALAGETVTFTKRIQHSNGERPLSKIELLPDAAGGFISVMHRLDAAERHNKDRSRLIHELDHRVRNILQVLHSVLALESQSAERRTFTVLEAIKARVDALSLSYELLSEAEPAGGWPVSLVLERIVAGVGPGISATSLADPGLRIRHDELETFVFIATEIARWASSSAGLARLEAQLVPEGLELSGEGSDGADLTTRAGSAGIALVESFARRSGAGPLRGGKRVSIIFPLHERGDSVAVGGD